MTQTRDYQVEYSGFLQRVASWVQGKLKVAFPSRNLGFAVLLFDLDTAGYMSYVSNGNREDMISVLRACADRLERGTAPLEPPPSMN